MSRLGVVGVVVGLLAVASCGGGAASHPDGGGGGGGHDGAGGVGGAGGATDGGAADAIGDTRGDTADAPPATDAKPDTPPADAPPAMDAKPDAPAADAPPATDATDAKPDAPASDAPSPDAAAGDAPAVTDGGAADVAFAHCGDPSAILCEDFESMGVGTFPTGAPWVDTSILSRCPSTGSMIAVEDTLAHSGAHALAIHSQENQCALVADLTVLPEVWVRVWVRSDAPGPDDRADHIDEISFFGIGQNVLADDPRVAVGYRGFQTGSCPQTGLDVNTSGGGYVTGCTSVAFPANQWRCLELHLQQPPAQPYTVKAELYVDGQQQTFRAVDGSTSTVVVNPNGPLARYLTLAVRQYQSSYTTPAYYDDLAVGTQRFGCN
jgi:hypothetical protein